MRSSSTPADAQDGATFELMGEAREATGLHVGGGIGDAVPEGLDVDIRLVADVLAEC